ncbi:hypothetical protein CTI12_AA188860 [Artemisia annua]|uniref:ARID domain-containing protein n=1 Tax=Artemisia annua TaxID=35608 RepID=A0A2U1P5W6_ARTAN|nr:hypothetical protein CTI12_AA188860 [Artemisia annua]
MVNTKHLIETNLLHTKPVTRFQQWYQSPRSDPWGKQVQRNAKHTLDKHYLQHNTIPNTPQWPKHKKYISPEGKQLLKKKVEEVVSYNSLKTTRPPLGSNYKQLGETSGLSKKMRRARCYVCKERGHVYWQCTNKEREVITEKKEPSAIISTTTKKPEEYGNFKYEPECVHVATDFMVEGSDRGNWDNIWYVSSVYKRHMSPMKHLFKRMIQYRGSKWKAQKKGKGRLFLSQKQYALEVLERAHMVNCNPSRTPVDTESKLGDDGDPVSDPTLYRSLAGSLQYLTFTRPDISYAAQQVCLHMHDPREPHLSALKRILRYVRGTLHYGLQLFASSTSSLVAYSDADWAGCPTTKRSTSGYCVFLGNNLLSWSSNTLSRSSAEAEYRGVANAVAETCWLRNLLRELHTPLSSATLVYCDNVSAVYLSCNPVQHQRTKHIEIDIHFVRDLVAAGQVRVLHVPSRYQYADIFTKGLPSALFEEFRSKITLNILSLDQLEEQGYMVSYEGNRCKVKYMFDGMEEQADVQGSTIEEEDEESIKISHNRFLDGYFRSLDLDEECSLIKGIEELKMDKGDEQDYVDSEYLSMNGTLYFMKMIEWFYMVYLKQELLGELPPSVGVIRIDLLGLYKFVDALGGYIEVTFSNKWSQVASLLGLAYENQEAVKKVYKEYIGMVKVYYEEAKRVQGKPEDVASNGRGAADIDGPQVDANLDAEIQDMLDETPRKRSKTVKDDVIMEEVKNRSSYEPTSERKEGSTSSSDDFVIIT